MATTPEIQLKKIAHYVHGLFATDATGHDFFHMQRVAHIAKEIAKNEQADVFICEAAGWLHDVGDEKLFSNPQAARHELKHFLQSLLLDKAIIQAIEVAIEAISFSNGKVPRTDAGKIVQDADRLDAIGAIGIARAFAYGGAHDQQIYSVPNHAHTSLQHFYDKLLTLKDGLHTKTAQSMAQERHDFMENFIEQFLKEWDMLDQTKEN